LVRLLENRNAGGSSIPAEAARLGAESVSLVGIIGESRIPRQWGRQVGDEQHLRPLLEDENFPQYKRDAIEVQLAVNAVTAELRDLLQPPQREI
jgi:hypothetical protein